MRTDELARALRDQLGIKIELHDTPVCSSFAPGVWLEAGAVHVCPWAALPGDVLHESGHWAKGLLFPPGGSAARVPTLRRRRRWCPFAARSWPARRRPRAAGSRHVQGRQLADHGSVGATL